MYTFGNYRLINARKSFATAISDRLRMKDGYLIFWMLAEIAVEKLLRRLDECPNKIIMSAYVFGSSPYRKN